jgi:filamentous hemagglutinin
VKLPHADRAVVDERKVRDYLLSRAHPIGRFKAAFFARAGFEAENWFDLVSQLRELAVREDAIPGDTTEHGTKYMISGTLKGPRGPELEVTSVWIVRTPGGAPRLVTVYPR